MWDELSERYAKVLRRAARAAQDAGELPPGDVEHVDFVVEEPRERQHGDLAANLALVLARPLRRPPRAIAEAIARHVAGEEAFVARVEVAGPGFLNAFLDERWQTQALRAILEAPATYGSRPIDEAAPRVLLEFVSANPVGPLNVVSGRAAVVGDVLASVLEARGYRVAREYYVNDAGGQAFLFGQSLLVRAREVARERGMDVDPGALPAQGYQSRDLIPIAAAFLDAHPEAARPTTPEAERALIQAAARFGMDRVLEGVRQSLLRYGVRFDRFVSEQRDVRDAGRLNTVLERLRRLEIPGQAGEREPCVVYGEPRTADASVEDEDEDDAGDGAVGLAPAGAGPTDRAAPTRPLILRTSRFGDDKDRVLVKSNGQFSYFAADIAYHEFKYERGFDLLIDLIGPDHHGYIPRMVAAMRMLGHPADSLEMRVVQLVRLVRGGQPVRMSKRRGEYVTLDELLDEVGTDATRFFLLARHMNSPLDFDLDLARAQVDENPVFYVQYAHARICSILRRAGEAWNAQAVFDARLLATPEEGNLIRILAQFPTEVRLAAELREPHRLARYAVDLAARFHSFYNRQRVLGVDPELMRARLALVASVAVVLRRALGLMGVTAPEQMERLDTAGTVGGERP